MTELTPRFALPLLQSGQAQKELFHNEALACIDTLLHPSVASIATNTPPASPVIGNAWIVGSAPTGAWIGKAAHIASWTGGGWRFLTPQAGLTAWLADTGRLAWHNGSSWQSGAWPSNGIAVGGTQVVGAQQPAIAGTTGGTTIDIEARAAVASILAALRGHGLIAA